MNDLKRQAIASLLSLCLLAGPSLSAAQQTIKLSRSVSNLGSNPQPSVKIESLSTPMAPLSGAPSLEPALLQHYAPLEAPAAEIQAAVIDAAEPAGPAQAAADYPQQVAGIFETVSKQWFKHAEKIPVIGGISAAIHNHALAKHQSPIPTAIAELQSPSPAKSRAARRALERYSLDGKHILSIASALSAPKAHMRRNAILAMRTKSLSEVVLAKLVKVIEEDAAESVRVEAALVLADNSLPRPIREELSRVIARGGPDVQALAAISLADAGGDFPDGVLLALAGTLKSKDNRIIVAAAGLLAKRRLPEAALEALLSGAGSHKYTAYARGRISWILETQAPLPEPIFAKLVKSLGTGPRPLERLAASVIENLDRLSAERKAALLDVLPQVHSKAIRRTLLKALEPWCTASELLAKLYPDQLAELKKLLPDLARVSARGASRFDLSSPRSLTAFIEYLKGLRSQNHGERSRGLLASFQEIADWKIRTILKPAGSDFAASGYRLPYPVAGVKSVKRQREPVFFSVSGDADAQAREKIQKSFSAFESVIAANFAALELLGKNAGALTKQTGRLVLDQVEKMVVFFPKIEAGKNPELTERFKKIKKDLEVLWAALPDQALLPAAIAARLSELEEGEPELDEIENVNTLINYIHRKSFDALLDASSNNDSGSRMRIDSRDDPKEVSLLNLGSEALTQDNRLVHPLLKAVAGPDIPDGLIILKGDQLAYHAQLGAHSAEILVKLAEPDEGGFLRMRYSESGSTNGNKLRMRYVAALLKRLGAASDIEGTYLNVSWDKDHGLNAKKQLEYALPLLLAAINRSSNLDFAFDNVYDNHAEKTSRRVADHMAETMLAEGVVPYFEDGSSSGLYEGYKKFIAKNKKRAALRKLLNHELKRLGLPAIVPALPFGQKTIDERFTAPIKLAAARGELAFDRDGRPQRRDYRPVDALAQAAAAGEEEALKLAALIEPLDQTELKFSAIGGVGRLRAERAQRLWDGEGVTAYVLREPDSGAIAYARAARWAGGVLTELDAAGLARLLEARLGGAAANPLPGPIQREKRRRLLRLPPLPPPARPTARGLAASSGRGAFVTAPVSFERGKTFAPGAILIAPFTTPDDIEIMRRAAAVITTGGGLLSHAAITTRELGIPAVILNGARRENAALVIDTERLAPAKQNPEGLWISRGVTRETISLSEGALIRLDGAKGEAVVFDALAAQAHQKMKILKNDPKKLASWIKSLDAKSRAPAARFLLEEAVSRKDWTILPPLMGAGAALREELKRHGAALIAARLARLEGSDADLQTEFEELSALSARLKLPAGVLAPLQARVAARSRLVAARRGEAIERWRAAAASWKGLSQLRSLIRRGQALGLDVAGLGRTLAEASKAKKLAIRKAGAAAIALDKIDDDYTEFVGGKSAKLGEIMQVVARHGGGVPGGVALTTDAYERFLKEAGLKDKIFQKAQELDALLDRADLNSEAVLGAVKERSAAIQKLLKSAKLSAKSGVGKEILQSLRDAGVADEVFAVRSSAIQEDGDEAAFAGAAETYLYVNFDDVLKKVVENWASFWLPRGIIYRRQQNIKSVELQPAVTIQKMADAAAAGVVFTINPVTRRPEIVINAAYGLGEGVVSGLVQADQYTANRDGEETSAAVIGDKKIKVVRKTKGSGTEEKTVPAQERRRRALTPEQVRQLSVIAAALEDHFGFALDIEFAVENGKIAILQARPVTTGKSAP